MIFMSAPMRTLKIGESLDPGDLSQSGAICACSITDFHGKNLGKV